MDTVVNLLSSPTGKLLIASSVVAALVTSIFNFLSIRSTNKRLIDIEKSKQSGEIAAFQYSKLFEASLDLEKIPSVNYVISNMKQLVEDTTSRFHAIESIYNRIEPLLAEPASSTVSTVKADVTHLSNKMLDAKYGNGEQVSLRNLMLKRQAFEEQVKLAISRRIKVLTNRAERG